MAGAEAVLQRNALALPPLTNALDHQLLGNRTSQLSPVITRQHRQQQVGHRHTAASGQAITVPIEQMAGGDDLGEALGKIVLPAPVHRSAVTIEQAEHGQRIYTRRQPTNNAAATGQLLECRGQRRPQRLGQLVSEQEQLVTTLQAPVPGLAGQAPGAILRRFGLQKGQLVNHIRMYPLGHQQYFLRQRQRQGLGAWPDEKTDSLGGHRVRSET
ncbi:hypothetical protein D3C78_646270 [compost metagenome]